MSVIIKSNGEQVEITREGNASKCIDPKNKAEIRAAVMELRRFGYTIREGKINEIVHKGLMIELN